MFQKQPIPVDICHKSKHCLFNFQRWWTGNFSSFFDYIMEQKGDENTETLVLCAWAIKPEQKKFGLPKLHYGPHTWSVRGISSLEESF